MGTFQADLVNVIPKICYIKNKSSVLTTSSWLFTPLQICAQWLIFQAVPSLEHKQTMKNTDVHLPLAFTKKLKDSNIG
jgi:hypothetical protein